MEFYLEPSGAITISRGDLLLTTCSKYVRIWITTMMTDRGGTFRFTAAYKVVTGDLYVTDKGPSLTIYDDRIFKALRDSVSIDVWHQVPHALCADITKLLDGYIY